MSAVLYVVIGYGLGILSCFLGSFRQRTNRVEELQLSLISKLIVEKEAVEKKLHELTGV